MKVLSINPFANVYAFKDWLIYSGGTDRPCKLSKDLNFPARFPDCDSRSLTLLDLFISYDPGIFCMVAFPPLENSDHVDVAVSINFPSNSEGCFFSYIL